MNVLRFTFLVSNASVLSALIGIRPAVPPYGSAKLRFSLLFFAHRIRRAQHVNLHHTAAACMRVTC